MRITIDCKKCGDLVEREHTMLFDRLCRGCLFARRKQKHKSAKEKNKCVYCSKETTNHSYCSKECRENEYGSVYYKGRKLTREEYARENNVG